MKIETLKVEGIYRSDFERYGFEIPPMVKMEGMSFEECKLKTRSKMADQLSIYEERMIRVLRYTEGPDSPQKSGCPMFEITCVILLKDEKEKTIEGST